MQLRRGGLVFLEKLDKCRRHRVPLNLFSHLHTVFLDKPTNQKLNSTQKKCLRQLYSIGFMKLSKETPDGVFLPSHFIINMPFQINLSSKLSHMMQCDGDAEGAKKKKKPA